MRPATDWDRPTETARARRLEDRQDQQRLAGRLGERQAIAAHQCPHGIAFEAEIQLGDIADRRVLFLLDREVPDMGGDLGAIQLRQPFVHGGRSQPFKQGIKGGALAFDQSLILGGGGGIGRHIDSDVGHFIHVHGGSNRECKHQEHHREPGNQKPREGPLQTVSKPLS